MKVSKPWISNMDFLEGVIPFTFLIFRLLRRGIYTKREFIEYMVYKGNMYKAKLNI